MQHKYTVRLRSGFAELWRYNIVAECGGFDAAGERVCFVSAQSVIAPVGSALRQAPSEPTHPRALTMTTEPCESITAYIYVIPNTLPVSREVQDCLPFGLKVSVTADGETVYDVTHKVNQWGGASIELKLPAQVPQRAGEIRQL